MGHANLDNLSTFFVKRLYAKGKLTVKECVEGLMLKGETLHASEGEYDDDAMLSYGVEQVVRHLLDYRENEGSRGSKDSPVIEPATQLNEEQTRILSEWRTKGEGSNWSADEGGEFTVLDSIPWKFTKGWRARYKEVEPLTHVTN